MKYTEILESDGKVRIPIELRKKVGFEISDTIVFEAEDDNALIIRREKDTHRYWKQKPSYMEKPTDEITLLDFLNELTPEEQRAALIHLSMIVTQHQVSEDNG